MKTKLLIVAASTLTLIGGHAFAASSTANLQVTASVAGHCAFDSTSAVAFTLDPSSAADGAASGNVKYWCSNGTSVSLAANDGANDTDAVVNGTGRRMEHDTTTNTDYIPYSLTFGGDWPNATGAGKTNLRTATVAGTVLNANYVNALVGNYTDTVTITMTW